MIENTGDRCYSRKLKKRNFRSTPSNTGSVSRVVSGLCVDCFKESFKLLKVNNCYMQKKSGDNANSIMSHQVMVQCDMLLNLLKLKTVIIVLQLRPRCS